MFHYVYKIAEGERYYFGVRSSKVPPEEDSYKGSGMAIICRVETTPRIKTIIATFLSRDEAEDAESALLHEHVGKSNCLNRKRRTRRISRVQ